MLTALGMGLLTVIVIFVATVGGVLVLTGVEDAEPSQIIAGIITLVILFAFLYYMIDLTSP